MRRPEQRADEPRGSQSSDEVCDLSKALIGFTDERCAEALPVHDEAPHPQDRVDSARALRHKTGEIRIPPEAQTGDYDLIVLASPTWWFQTSMPIHSYLESPEAKTVLSGKPFAYASISRRYYGINLRQQKKLGQHNGARWIDKTHFVCAGGQVKSMLAWLGYMKHGEPQERVIGAEDVPAQPQARLEEQVGAFVDASRTRSGKRFPRRASATASRPPSPTAHRRNGGSLLV